jgi:hypothetical protein
MRPQTSMLVTLSVAASHPFDARPVVCVSCRRSGREGWPRRRRPESGRSRRCRRRWRRGTAPSRSCRLTWRHGTTASRSWRRRWRRWRAARLSWRASWRPPTRSWRPRGACACSWSGLWLRSGEQWGRCRHRWGRCGAAASWLLAAMQPQARQRCCAVLALTGRAYGGITLRLLPFSPRSPLHSHLPPGFSGVPAGGGV